MFKIFYHYKNIKKILQCDRDTAIDIMAKDTSLVSNSLLLSAYSEKEDPVYHPIPSFVDTVITNLVNIRFDALKPNH